MIHAYRSMTKKRWALLLLTLVLFVGATAIAEDVAPKATYTIDCSDCNASGVCMNCVGLLEDPDAVCDACEGTHICATCGGTGQVAVTSKVYATFWGLVPPIIAIALALITKEVYSSLFIGIVAGALFYTNFEPVATLDAIVNRGLIAKLSDSGNVGILLFLVILGVIVAVINRAGGSAAFGRWTEKHVKTRVGAQFCAFVLGVLIFIDDYFNCLTVGSVMRPVTDRHHVSRAKLAYLIDSTAAPICMIAPISSWAAAVSSYVNSEQYSGIQMFINAIPYNFYSILTILMVCFMIFSKSEYGPMKRFERNALNGDVFSGGEIGAEQEEANPKGRVIDLILPILLLVLCCVAGMLYTGEFFAGASFIDAFANCSASVGLSLGSLVALVLTFIYMWLRRIVSFKDSMDCIVKGFNAMVPPILILTFAWSLSGLTALLGGNLFVKEFMMNAAPGLKSMMPAIIFIVACCLSFATGTSWGTMGILLPIVLSCFPEGAELYTISISAVCAGAVCGDHCSPISDTTIMSSAGARCKHVDHVATQLPYTLTAAAVSFVSFILAGLIQNVWVALPLSIALMIGTLIFLRSKASKVEA